MKSKQQKNPNPSDLCIIPPDDDYNLQLNLNAYNAVVAKAHI